MKASLGALAVLSLVAGVGMFNASAATADDTAVEQTCRGLSTGTIPVYGENTSWEVTAPEGMVIVGTCVKAGSANQGDGPEYLTVRGGAESVVLTHPSGKAISHYSLEFQNIEPAVITIDDTNLVPPTLPDKCGVTYDDIVVPSDAVGYSWVQEGNIVEREAWVGHRFADGAQTVWPFSIPDNPCHLPEMIGEIEWPEFVDKCGIENDALIIPTGDDVPTTYVVTGDSATGFTVIVSAKEGYFLAQDLDPEGFFPALNVPCEAPPVFVDICENVDGYQEVVPSGMTVDDAGNCSTPAAAVPGVKNDEPAQPVKKEEPAAVVPVSLEKVDAEPTRTYEATAAYPTELAATGVDLSTIALGATGVLAVGAGAMLVAKSRRSLIASK